MENRLEKIFIALLWLILGAVICVLGWGMNKGFDFTDEGFNMLSFMKGQEDIWHFRPIYPILAALADWANPGVIFFRALRLMLLLLASIVFAYGFIEWCRNEIQGSVLSSFAFLYPVICLSSLMSYAFGYAVLSYNSLTLILVELASGLFFWGVSDRHHPGMRMKTLLVFFSLGFFFGVLFLVKFSSAGCLAAILLPFFVLCYPVTRKEQFRAAFGNLLSAAGGILFLALLLGVFYRSPLLVFKEITSGKDYFPGHSTSFLLHLYADDFREQFIKFIFDYPAAWLGPLFLWLALRYAHFGLFLLTVVSFILCMTVDVFRHEYYKSGMSYFYVASALYRLLSASFLFFVVLSACDRKTRTIWGSLIRYPWAFLSGLAVLLAIPFVCSFGTANVLSGHITQFIFSWSLLFIVGFHLLFAVFPRARGVFFTGTILLMINISSQIIYGYVLAPYRVNTALMEQKYPVPELARSNNLLFDEETRIFLHSTVEKLREHHSSEPGQPIICIYNYPGLTYLLGGYSPGNAWYFDSGYENYLNGGYHSDFNRTNCFFVMNSQMKNLDHAIILEEQQYPVTDRLAECLREKGILFPEGYFKADSVQVPGGRQELYIYLPRSAGQTH